ncbi:hypothetical protein FA15DRAFT_623113 [Coprinopsis marcescibilis]|uniref:G-protein coupled receptors family 1 profile domain-containing protein n=1 Tax=Coprinopsis marcescibilis TaxID=230819 RepID=A0A5C3KP02_COPMA|nr:hypothetical protein FA15DRAFT_623113 [Coprinopsis marcescibilis]
MSSTIAQEAAARMSMTSLYTIIPVSFAVIGMQIFMCLFGAIIFSETPRSSRKGRGPYIAASWLILVLFSLSQVADGVEVFNLLANSTSHLQAVTQLKNQYEYSWWRISTTTCLYICNWVGDGLLLYRCYKIWNDQPWIVVLPVLTYIASCGLCVASIVNRVKWLADASIGPGPYGTTLKAYLFLSVSVNCMATALISFRLLRIRRQLSQVLSKQDLRIYLGIIAILVESALPLSVAGIAFAILSTPSASGAVTVARTTVLLIWFSLNALCPQMIIFRVTTGRSWIGSPAGSVQSSARHHGTMIEFIVNPDLSETKNDPEASNESFERRRVLSPVSEEHGNTESSGDKRIAASKETL